MKGAAMQVLWPGEIPIADLLSFITLEVNEQFTGNYGYFLNYELVPPLGTDTIIPALRWVETMVASLAQGNHFHLRRLIDQILLKGLELIGDPQILIVFGEALASCLNSEHRFISRGMGEREDLKKRLTCFAELRRSVLKATIPAINHDQVHELLDFGLVIATDFSWVFDILSSPDPFVDKHEDVFIEIGIMLFDRSIDGHFEEIYAATFSRPIIKEKMKWLFGPIGVDSEEARVARRYLETQKQWKQERQQLDPPPDARILLPVYVLSSASFYGSVRICFMRRHQPV